MKTLAAVLYEQHKPLVIEELTIPALKESQVLARILYSGVCQTQLNEIKGTKGIDKYLPHTLGHEASGIVEDVGKSVVKVKPGDYIVLSWIKGLGVETPSSQYATDSGSIVNAGAVTTFQEYSVVSENRITPISVDMPHDVSALLGCAVPTGAGIFRRKINPSPKESLAIFGIGGIGSSALLMASSLGLEKIIAIDINGNKLEQAIALGATHTINANEEDPVKKIYEITNNQGVDFAIESSGVRRVMEDAYNSTNKHTGTVVLSGNLGNGVITINPYDLLFGKKLIGTGEHNTFPHEDFSYYSQMFLEGKLPLEKLISRIYKLEQINDALDALSKGEVFRSLIDFT